MVNSISQTPNFVRTLDGGYLKADSVVYLQRDRNNTDEFDVFSNDGTRYGSQTRISACEAGKILNQII